MYIVHFLSHTFTDLRASFVYDILQGIYLSSSPVGADICSKDASACACVYVPRTRGMFNCKNTLHVNSDKEILEGRAHGNRIALVNIINQNI